MKTLSLALSLFVAAFFVASCDDLTTVEIPFGLSTEHHFEVSGTELTFHDEESVDLTTNSSFNDHKNSIKETGVDSIAIRITGHNGPIDQTVSGQVMVGPTATDLVELAAISGLNLAQIQTATANDVWMTIPTSEAGRQRIADLIKTAPHAATLVLDGTSNYPSNFTAHFKIFWSMKATQEVI